jgi:membrane-associated phospholipid phosphatase
MQVAITNLGDLASALPLALLLIVWCIAGRNLLMAGAVGGATLLTVVATAGLKAVSIAVNPPLDVSQEFVLSTGAPSGHAAIVGAVYAAAAVVLLRCSPSVARTLGVAWCLFAVAGVAITRVTLLTHTIADVFTGLLLALVITAGLFAVARRSRIGDGRNALPLLAGMLLIAVAAELSGIRITSTEFL